MQQITETLSRLLEQLSEVHKEVIKKNTPFLTIEETSEYTNIPIHTLYMYTSQRSIPFYKTGRKLYFSREELNQWILDRNKRSSTVSEIESDVITQMHIGG